MKDKKTATIHHRIVNLFLCFVYRIVIGCLCVCAFMIVHMSVQKYVCFLLTEYISVLLNWTHISKIVQTIECNESNFSMQLQLRPDVLLLKKNDWKNICNLSTLFKQSWFHGMSIDMFYIFSSSKRFASKWMRTIFQLNIVYISRKFVLK